MDEVLLLRLANHVACVVIPLIKRQQQSTLFTPNPKKDEPTMAQQTIIQLLDDLDGSEASETIVFSLDGKTYEIDLNEKNAAKLRKALAPYVDKGRKLSQPRGGKRAGAGRSTADGDTAQIRAWAKENGYDVNDRGRVSAEIKEAYAKVKAA
ncbi:hypothetical protein QF026_004791 [Streptomyces aurantiacus]|nr:hypothetical protein [Streptomyces aurantiacus]